VDRAQDLFEGVCLAEWLARFAERPGPGTEPRGIPLSPRPQEVDSG
jgi:hypothetical protein